MKFTVDRTVLQKRLDLASRIMARKRDQGITNSAFLKLKDGTLGLKVTNGILGIVCRVGAATGDNCEVVVPFDKLYHVVSKSTVAKVSFEFKKEGRWTITANGKYEVATFPVEEFPALEVRGEPLTEIDLVELRNKLKKTSKTVSLDDGAPALTGILWDGNFVSTDRKRMSVALGEKKNFRLTVPPQIIDVLDGIEKGTVVVQIPSVQHLLVLKIGDIIIQSRILSGEFPKYEDAISRAEKEGMKELVLVKSDLAEVLDRCSVFRDDSNVVQIDIEKGEVGVQIGTENSGAEKIKRKIDGTDDDKFSIFLDIDSLLQCIEVLDKPEFRMKFSTPDSPVIVYEEGLKIMLSSYRLRG